MSEKREEIRDIVEELNYIIFDEDVRSELLKKMLLMMREGFEQAKDDGDFYNAILEPKPLEKHKLRIGENQQGVQPIDCRIVKGAISSVFKTDSLFYRMKFFADGEILIAQNTRNWNACCLRLDTEIIDLT